MPTGYTISYSKRLRVLWSLPQFLVQVGVQLALFAASVMSKKEFVLRVIGARLVILTVVGTYVPLLQCARDCW